MKQKYIQACNINLEVLSGSRSLLSNSSMLRFSKMGYILHIGETSTICTYIAHWGKKYNVAQILRIGRESCANLAILHIDKRKS